MLCCLGPLEGLGGQVQGSEAGEEGQAHRQWPQIQGEECPPGGRPGPGEATGLPGPYPATDPPPKCLQHTASQAYPPQARASPGLSFPTLLASSPCPPAGCAQPGSPAASPLHGPRLLTCRTEFRTIWTLRGQTFFLPLLSVSEQTPPPPPRAPAPTFLAAREPLSLPTFQTSPLLPTQGSE